MSQRLQQVQNFPFETLPQIRSEDYDFLVQVKNLYTVLEEHEDLFQDLLKPLQDVLPLSFYGEISRIDCVSAENVQKNLSESLLLALIQFPPHQKKGFLIFDKILAQILVDGLLSGTKISAEQLALNQLKPITSLSEAVVVYILVSVMERLSEALGKTNFTMAFDQLLRDPVKFQSLYSLKDRFAFFTICLKTQARDFYCHLGLPIDFARDFSILKKQDQFSRLRSEHFGGFKVPFQLEIGQASLSPEEFSALEEGDILLLETEGVRKTQEGLRGQAKLKPVGLDHEIGYHVNFDATAEEIRAIVKEVL